MTRIDVSTTKAAQEAAETAKKHIAAMVAEQEKNLSAAVYLSAEKAATAASTKTMLKWIVGAMLACSLVVCVLGFYMYQQGKQAGIAIAQDKDLKLMQRDNWTGTDMYKLAYAYDKKGILEKILLCTAKGWEKKFVHEGKLSRTGFCFPTAFEEDNKNHKSGWEIPDYE